MQRVNRVSEHLLEWNWTRLLVAANPARCGGSLANDRYNFQTLRDQLPTTEPANTWCSYNAGPIPMALISTWQVVL